MVFKQLLLDLKIFLISPGLFFEEAERSEWDNMPYKFALISFVLSSLVVWVADEGFIPYDVSEGISFLIFIFLSPITTFAVYIASAKILNIIAGLLKLDLGKEKFLSIFGYSSIAILATVLLVELRPPFSNEIGLVFWYIIMGRSLQHLESSKVIRLAFVVLLSFLPYIAALFSLVINLAMLS